MIFNFKMNRGGFGYRRAGVYADAAVVHRGRKMAERVRYRTKQQELIRDCLEKHSDRFVTAEQCMDCLKAEGIHVGQTTVYRALDRLTEENAVIKIPAVDGVREYARMPQWFTGGEKWQNVSDIERSNRS